ncbi:MAG: helix-turn-helix transcriptional regulator [Lachnospiraceae bacterium]|jgi:Predicted transcriptional regulators|nr:helix-turn-helix transcriptional regulator [Lachnospiraceae bacterium]
MEQKKIGEFIAAQRKEKQMTQKQLGEALGISDKAISKWECGKGLPDISIMMPLCELLEINVNELLSGEHLTEDAYSRKAEENMMNLIQETENQKKENTRGNILRTVTWVMGNILILLMLIMTSASQANFPIAFYLDMPSLIAMLFYLYLTLFFTGHTKDFKNAFSFLRRRKPESIEEAQKAIMALSLAMKSLITAGGFCTLFFSIYLLWLTTNSMDLSTFTANMAVTLIPFLYGLIGAAILIPVKGRLENRI